MFVKLDAGGLPVAFYSPATHGGRIPIDAVEITEAMWRECLENQGIRRIVVTDGQPAVVPYEPPGELDRLKDRRRAEIDALFSSKLEQGIPYGGKVLQLREQDQQNISASALMAEMVMSGTTGVAWPVPFAWRMADNSYLPLTPEEMAAMAEVAANEVLRLRQVAWSHKDAIDALTTPQEVLSYPIDGGW